MRKIDDDQSQWGKLMILNIIEENRWWSIPLRKIDYTVLHLDEGNRWWSISVREIDNTQSQWGKLMILNIIEGNWWYSILLREIDDIHTQSQNICKTTFRVRDGKIERKLTGGWPII